MEDAYFKQVGDVGINWVRKCLGEGEHFSKAVEQHVSIDGGTVLIAVVDPRHESAVVEQQPLNTGQINVPVVSRKAQLDLLLAKLLKLEEEHGPLMILVEDNLMYPTDKVKKTLPNVALLQLKDRYLHAKAIAEIKSAEDLNTLLGKSSGYPLNAFVVRMVSDLTPEKSISEDDAEKLYDSLVGIINYAYDGETFALWIRDDKSWPA